MRTIKYLLVATIFLFVLPACKKTVENIKEDLVIKAMVDGQWGVTNFSLNGTDITSDFSAYKFKYYNNPKNVDAIKNGTVEKTGTWDGDAASMTTYANFTSPPYPLTLINGSWHITRSGWTYVEATQTENGNTKMMRLDKQ
jgi:hypothetical protein